MIKIEEVTTGDRTIVIRGKMINTDEWKNYLSKAIKGIINETDYAISDDDLTRKINAQTAGNPEQEINFIVQINKP